MTGQGITYSLVTYGIVSSKQRPELWHRANQIRVKGMWWVTRGSGVLKTVHLAYLRCGKSIASEVAEPSVSHGREVEYGTTQAMETSPCRPVSTE